MPHADFDASRRAYQIDRDPVTFTLGGETFTVLPDPSLGDTFDLADAPDITPADLSSDGSPDLVLVRTLARFIRRMLPPDDRARYDKALYSVPSTHSYVIVECAVFITEQVTSRPSEPSGSSSPGRRKTTTGRSSKPTSAGRTPSKTSRRGGPTR